MAQELSSNNTQLKQHFLYQPQHLFGCYFVIFGYILKSFGFLSFAWYWILIIFYVIGRIVWGRLSAQTHQQPPEQKAKIRKGGSYETGYFLTDFLSLKYRSEHLLPTEAAKRLNNIHQLLVSLNQQLSHQNHLLRSEIAKIQQIVSLYLTPTIENYLKIPVLYAENRVLADQKTANMSLIEQLNLLEEELYKTLDSVLSDNLDELVIHGQFLQQKFKPYDFFKLDNNNSSELPYEK